MDTNGQEDGATTWSVADTKNLTIQGEKKSGTLIAKAAGRIDGSNAREFQDALDTFLEGEISAFILDMENLTYISSAGLRVILTRLQEATEVILQVRHLRSLRVHWRGIPDQRLRQDHPDPPHPGRCALRYQQLTASLAPEPIFMPTPSAGTRSVSHASITGHS